MGMTILGLRPGAGGGICSMMNIMMNITEKTIVNIAKR